MPGGVHQPVTASQDEPGRTGAAGLAEQVRQPIAAIVPCTADAAPEGPTEGSLTVLQVCMVGVLAQVGKDPDAVVTDGHFQAAGPGGLSGVRLGGDKSASRTTPMANGVVDEFPDTAGDLGTWGHAKVGNGEKPYALTHLVGSIRGQQGGLKERRAEIAPVIERNGSDNSGAFRKLGQEVHPLQVGGDTTVGGEKQNAVARHDRSSLSERRHGGEVKWADELQPRGVDGEGFLRVPVEDQVSTEQRVASGEFE